MTTPHRWPLPDANGAPTGTKQARALSAVNLNTHADAITEVRAYFAYVANATAYGAKGDGVTDDTAAIQATIAAVQAGGGGTVLLPGTGTYLTDALSISAPNVALRGEGGRLLLKAGANKTLLTISAVSGVTVSGLILDGGSAQTYISTDTVGTRTGIVMGGNGSDYNALTRLIVKGFTQDGIRLVGHGQMDVGDKYAHIQDVFVSNCFNGVTIEDRSEYNHLTGVTVSGCYTGFRIFGANNSIVNSQSRMNVDGAYIGETAGGNSGHGGFTGTSFNHCSRYGVNIQTIASGYGFTGCEFHANLLAAYVNNARLVRFVSSAFTGETAGVITISGGGGHAIVGCTFRYKSSITLSNVAACTITGNTWNTDAVSTITITNGGAHIFSGNIFAGTVTLSRSGDTAVFVGNPGGLGGRTIANIAAPPTMADFNGLLSTLRAIGILAP